MAKFLFVLTNIKINGQKLLKLCTLSKRLRSLRSSSEHENEKKVTNMFAGKIQKQDPYRISFDA